MYLDNFKNKQDVLEAFSDRDSNSFIDLSKCNILFAYYGYEDYSGLSFVLYEQDGKLYEVNGSHCSCNGLEGQWSPEEVTIEQLQHRLTEGSLGKNYSDEEIFSIPLSKVIHNLNFTEKFNEMLNDPKS